VPLESTRIPEAHLSYSYVQPQPGEKARSSADGRSSATLIKNEAGYSLVEVMASIMILAIAIIPMVGMFDLGLETATRGSNYDKARALAKKQLESVQSLPYGTVKTNFPSMPCTFNASGLCEPGTRQNPSGEFSSFRYKVSKQYVQLNASGTAFENVTTDRGMMRVTVEVGWGGANFDEKTYTATALKAR
jgi:prepilin-type N-terminal cleavage/methylation domain-containing protein